MAKRRVHRPSGTPTINRDRRRVSASAANGRGGSGAKASGRRERFEQASAPWLARMAATPTFLIPALMGIALFIGLVVSSPWAALPLVAIAAFLGWLAALSWPSLSGSSRALRLLVVGALTGLAVFKVLGRF